MPPAATGRFVAPRRRRLQRCGSVSMSSGCGSAGRGAAWRTVSLRVDTQLCRHCTSIIAGHHGASIASSAGFDAAALISHCVSPARSNCFHDCSPANWYWPPVPPNCSGMPSPPVTRPVAGSKPATVPADCCGPTSARRRAGRCAGDVPGRAAQRRRLRVGPGRARCVCAAAYPGSLGALRGGAAGLTGLAVLAGRVAGADHQSEMCGAVARCDGEPARNDQRIDDQDLLDAGQSASRDAVDGDQVAQQRSDGRVEIT